MPCRASQDGHIVESSHKMWSTGGGNGKPLLYSCLDSPMNSMKEQTYNTKKWAPKVRRCPTCSWGSARCSVVSDCLWPHRLYPSTPLSMGFSRQDYWSGLPLPPPGDLPDPGIKPRSPALQTNTLPSEPPGKDRGQLLISQERMKWLGQSGNDPQLWMCLLVKVESCCSEQYCIVTWNVRPVNQGKLNLANQEMARVNINILESVNWNGQEWVNLIQITIILLLWEKIP